MDDPDDPWVTPTHILVRERTDSSFVLPSSSILTSTSKFTSLVSAVVSIFEPVSLSSLILTGEDSALDSMAIIPLYHSSMGLRPPMCTVSYWTREGIVNMYVALRDNQRTNLGSVTIAPPHRAGETESAMF